MSRIVGACVSCLLLAGATLDVRGEAPPAFTRKPTAARDGEKVKIAFAVDRETDVAVFIEDSRGKVVRHLVAGVLGKNPPPPLEAGSLAQTVEWDGQADYGKPAGAGPFQVRVALGVGARYDKVLIHDRSLRDAPAIGVGPDGTLYVVTTCGGSAWSGRLLLALNRDGSYQRTLMPFPSNLGEDRVKGFNVFELNGRPTPQVQRTVDNQHPPLSFYPTYGSPRRSTVTVANGRICLLMGDSGKCYVVMLDGEGGCPGDSFTGPSLLPSEPRAGFNERPFISASSDGTCVFVSGLKKSRYDKEDQAAVFRVALPERTSVEPFFGEPGEAGSDQTHLAGAPHGMALDGKGHLLIADTLNDRVVLVGEKDGKYVGELKVDRPDCLGVDPATGAVYVTRPLDQGAVELVKLSGVKDPKVLASIQFPRDGNPAYPWIAAVDVAARPPIIWMSGDSGTLLRVEDLGDTFSDPKQVYEPNERANDFLDLTVDHFRNEVYARGARPKPSGPYWWWRYSEQEDRLGTVSVTPGSAAGSSLAAAPDGSLYATSYTRGIYRFSRDGKPLPWAQPRPLPPDHKDRALPPHVTFAPVSEGWMAHWVGVRADGHIFLMEPPHNGNRPPKMLYEYLPSGQRASEDPIIWKLSDGAIGPKFDQQGNIYIAEIVKPKEYTYPPEFEGLLGKVEIDKPCSGLQDLTANMYGSIVKFSPKGGVIRYGLLHDAGGRTTADPFEGEPKLASGLRTTEAAYYNYGKLKAVKVTGAEWMAPGYSHVEDVYCTCETTRFDVDQFGRVWYPDLNLFQVRVVDTNGNPITRFGGYGNAESKGPDSPVVDPRTKRLRPRRPDDPKGLASPFAEPEIAFAWLVGVGVTDKYIYTGDSMNRRMLRLALTYAREETCAVK